MKDIFNKILLGSALAMVAVSVNWAEPSLDLMNAINNTRLRAEKTTANTSASLNAKHGCAGCQSRTGTQSVTAGQCTVAVPVTVPMPGCCKK